MTEIKGLSPELGSRVGVRGTEEFARPHEEEEPHDGELEDVVIDGAFRRVFEVEVVAHGGEEDSADGIHSGGWSVGTVKALDAISVDLM